MGAIIASIIISVLGEAAQYAANDYKNKVSMSADELQLAITKAIEIASQKGQNKLDELSNKLLSVDFINKSPTLKSIINNRKKKIKSEMDSLRSDINELNLIGMDENLERDKLYDTNFFETDNQYNKYKEKHDENEKKINEISERIEQRL